MPNEKTVAKLFKNLRFRMSPGWDDAQMAGPAQFQVQVAVPLCG